jgi:hypothetical protein
MEVVPLDELARALKGPVDIVRCRSDSAEAERDNCIACGCIVVRCGPVCTAAFSRTIGFSIGSDGGEGADLAGL